MQTITAKKPVSMRISQDAFSLILPHLTFDEILRCTAVCKDWKNMPRNHIMKHVVQIHYFPDQIPLLRRVKVEGLKLYSRRDVGRLIPMYNEHFAHTKELQMWVEEESVIRLSNADRQNSDDVELLNLVGARAYDLCASLSSGVSFHSLLHLEIGNLVLSATACPMFAKVLGAMPSLQELHFQYLLFTNGNDKVVWDALETMDNLVRLHFIMVKGQSSFRRVPKNLKYLDTHRIGLTGENAMHLMQNLPAHSIESVMMHGFWNDFRLLESDLIQYDLLNFGHLTRMHTLHLQNVDMTPSEFQRLIARLPGSLQRLNVACNFLGGGGLIRAFRNGAAMPKSLKWLDMSSNDLACRDLRCIVRHCMDGLETLILDGNEELFGTPNPNPVHVLVFCEVVRSHVANTLRRIDCKNCGWDMINPATRQLMYPELLAQTADVAAWGALYEKK